MMVRRANVSEVQFYEVVQRCAPQDVPVLMEYIEGVHQAARQQVRRAGRASLIRGFLVGGVATLVAGAAIRAYGASPRRGSSRRRW